MQTYPLNSLAESFEVDRSTMVRAMRNVQPDLVKRGNRPTWKTSTAARALEAHRRKNDGGGNGGTGTDPGLAALYARFDQAEAAMRYLPTLDARRAAARILAPLVAEIDRAVRAHGRVVGNDVERTDLRADRMYLLACRGLEGPCAWSLDEAFEAMRETADA
jgi:hypothetical protein